MTVQVLCDVMDERLRQEYLKRQGRFAATCADATLSDEECLVILVEEIGEVARALQEEGPAELRTELVQVAAVAVAWIERLDGSRLWGGPNDPED